MFGGFAYKVGLVFPPHLRAPHFEDGQTPPVQAEFLQNRVSNIFENGFVALGPPRSIKTEFFNDD